MENQDSRSVMGEQESGRDNRVAHLTTVHHPQDPRISRKQLPTLREGGFDVVLVASGRDEQMPSGLPTVSLPPTESRLQRLPLLGTTYRRARAVEADVYHLHDPELIPVGFLLKRTTGAAVIYDMHEDYEMKGRFLGCMLRLLERWCFSWVDHVLLAEKSYRTIVAGHAVDWTYIANYYKPIGEESKPAPTAETSMRTPSRLLYTGTISNSRGLSTMLDLASALEAQDRSVLLDLVGICRLPEQRRAAEQRIREEGLGPIVNRIGWDTYVSPEAMPPYYRRADVGLALCEPHPNLTGSVLTKFYEYLHHGLPIICSEFPLWRQFIEENECGAVVPAGDTEAVLQVLAQWRRHPDEHRKYAENARSAASNYRWKKMGRQLVQVYRNVLSSSEEIGTNPPSA